MAKRLSVKKQSGGGESTQEIPAHGIITVGSDHSATVTLEGGDVAPEQFIIVCEDGQMTLMCRVDGNTINGETLAQGALHNLQTHDVITVGDYVLAVENEGEPAPLPEPVREPEEKIADQTGGLQDILAGLRAEEKFYFQIYKITGETSRVYVESDELWLGWTATGECAVGSENLLTAARAQIRKDWTGVQLYPLQKNRVRVNNEMLDEPRRLRNDDQITLTGAEGTAFAEDFIVKFHEPTALLVLDSILPKELPPPVSLVDERPATEALTETNAPNAKKNPAQAKVKTVAAKRLFRYFTPSEVMIMAIGTLVGAAMIFLVLVFY